MLTTVLSMKAMPEARIVAARIHGCARAVHGISAFVDSITAWSHGGFMAAVDASRLDSVGPGPSAATLRKHRITHSQNPQIVSRETEGHLFRG
jgi:hypothetical protein